MDLTNKTVGPHEESGFTHAYNVEPITYIPGSPHKNEMPVRSLSPSTSSPVFNVYFNILKVDTLFKQQILLFAFESLSKFSYFNFWLIDDDFVIKALYVYVFRVGLREGLQEPA